MSLAIISQLWHSQHSYSTPGLKKKKQEKSLYQPTKYLASTVFSVDRYVGTSSDDLLKLNSNRGKSNKREIQAHLPGH